MTMHHLRRSLFRCGVGVFVLAWLPMPSFAQAAQPADADARAEHIVQKMPPEALHGLVQSYFMGGTAKQPPGSIGGSMIAGEARAQGINVLLAGGINLAREPRNGRTFEYFGEDPLLAGTMDGAEIRGIQSRHVVSTIKHFALNAQETKRGWPSI